MLALRSIVVLSLALVARAQSPCANWQAGFELPGVQGRATCSTTYDVGFGPRLYVGGAFTSLGAQSVTTTVLEWDGSTWQSLVGAPPYGTVYALRGFDDGVRPALYVGGHSGGPFVRKYDGSSWSDPGGGVSTSITPIGAGVRALEVFDADGPGPIAPALFAGGDFQLADFAIVNGIARWDGTSWTGLGSGFNASGNSIPYALRAWPQSPGGPALYAAGHVLGVSGITAHGIARWNGTSWDAVQGGVDGDVAELALLDDGGGERLWLAGPFANAGGVPSARVARFGPNGWEATPSPSSATPSSLVVHDLGNGPELLAAWTDAGASARFDAIRVARWSAGTWSALPGSVGGRDGELLACDAPIGPANALFLGGDVRSIDAFAASGLVQHDGARWNRLFGTGRGASQPVAALLVADVQAPGGEALYAGGKFASAFGVPAASVVRWDGAVATPLDLDAGAASVRALFAFDDGAGRALYAGGQFDGNGLRNVARWNGSTWSSVGANGLGSATDFVRALAAFDDGNGPALYAAGRFNGSGAPPRHVAKWNGTSWTIAGLNHGFNEIGALIAFDDGSGMRLWAGGASTATSTMPGVARWNGSTWSAAGSGIQGTVSCFVVHDSGAGPELYAGGSFLQAGGQSAHNVARWDGTNWRPVGASLSGMNGIDGAVNALASFDDGSGSALWAVGALNGLGGGVSETLVRFDGTTWFPFGGMPLGSTCAALAGFRGELVIGGDFAVTGAVPSSNLAAWSCGAWSEAFCVGDGSESAAATGCPCNNTGGPRRGCASSRAPNGAELAITGTLRPDQATLRASDLPFTATCLFVKSDLANAAGVRFGDGVSCVAGVVARIGVKGASSGVALHPGPSDVALSVASGTAPGSGSIACYQAWYRNAAAAFCPPATANATNALRVVW